MSKPEGDLKNRPLIELNEILERQKKLLANKYVPYNKQNPLNSKAVFTLYFKF